MVPPSRLLIPCFLAAALGAQGGAYFPPPEDQGGWRSLVRANAVPTWPERTAVRRHVRMRVGPLLEARDLLRPHGGAFLIVRHGWVVAEWGAVTTPHHVASVAKSLTAIAIQRMLERSEAGAFGAPISLEDPVHPHLAPGWLALDPAKAEIRFEHLLTMSSGLMFHDSPQPTTTYLQTVLRRPLVSEPGTEWTYSSAPVDLLSVILTNVTGRTLRDFFQDEVGDAIGMAPFAWQPMGPYTVASAYAHLTVRDAARPMYLLLRGGAWNGVPVLSRAGAERLKARAPSLSGATFGVPNSPFVTNPLAPSIYGHLLWTHWGELSSLGTSAPEDAIYMAGHGTSFVVGVPSEDLIVVRLGDGPAPWDDLLVSVVMDLVLEAVDRGPDTDARRLPQPAGGLRR